MVALDTHTPFARVVTQDARVREIIEFAMRVAPSPHPLLLLGETGTGKDLFAEEFHRASGFSGPFVAENVAGLDDQLFSDVMFGHTRGAFTGAVTDRQGLIARAEGGTLFLDEIGDLSIASQIKLLRVIENRQYHRLGTDEALPVHTRFVFATSSNLLHRIDSGQFRPDLYFRLSAYELHLPPLRDRDEDLVLLVDHFVKEASSSLRIDAPKVESSFIERIRRHHFPGNLRELKMLLLKSVTWSEGHGLHGELAETVLQNHLAVELKHDLSGAHPAGTGRRRSVVFQDRLPTMLELRKELIREALRRTNGNQSQAAKIIGLTPAAVNKFLAKYQL